jgi:putative MATE family efflux protein
MNDLTKGSIVKGLILFTLPLLLGNFFQILYHTMDTLIVGQTLGKNALASVGATGSLNWLIVGFAQGITSGMAIITAQRYGAKDSLGIKKSYATGLLFTAGISIVLAIISVLSLEWLLTIMQTPQEIFQGAKDFSLIMLAFMVVSNLYAYIAATLRSLGDSKTPLIALIVASIANIAFEYIAILGFKLGIIGASSATIIAQAVSVIYLLIHIKKHVPELQLNRDHFKFDREEYASLFRLGIPMGFQSSIIALGSITLQVALNRLGTDAIAMQAIASKIDQFAMLPMMSVGLAMSTFAAQNLGAKQHDRILSGLNKSLWFTVAWGILFGAILIMFNHQFTTLFVSAKETTVISMAKHYYIINGSLYWILSTLFVTRATIQGLGNATIPTIAGFMELFFRAGVAILGVITANFSIVVAANPAAWIGSVMILIPTITKVYKAYRQEAI